MAWKHGLAGLLVLGAAACHWMASPTVAADSDIIGDGTAGPLQIAGGKGEVQDATPYSDEGGSASGGGPDVIVGDMPNVHRWGRVAGVTAYSVATTSCNIGTERLDWIEETNNHPVIAQNMYRLKDGRFEQIGLSWLKHGFYALSGSLCSPCNDPTDGSQLGVGCSDPYTAGLNGQQDNLGPRYEVNPVTGYFPYPFSAPNYSATLGRRLQVADADIDPDVNAGAIYFVEAHYITPSDAVQGGDGINNAHDNASYRRVTVSESPTNSFNVNTSLDFPTQREKPAIIAWRDIDSAVKIDTINIEGDGRMILAHKVTDLGNNTWRYEYALQNLNSDRSGTLFSVPAPTGVTITNVGFHAVRDHSGAPYNTSDWTATVAGGQLQWAGEPYETNPNANALRWGSLYNFRFDANVPPAAGTLTVGLFKPGTPETIEVTVSVPDLALALLTSIPPSDAIDARQPSDIDGSNPVGWQSVELTFNGYALELDANEFTVTQEGGNEPPPTIIALVPITDETVNAVLDRSISPGAWTTITHTSSATSTRVGYLPGDADGDATSSPLDVLALIDHLNGVLQPPLEIWQCDMNRSGLCELADILRAIDLLNGAGEFEAYNGATLP